MCSGRFSISLPCMVEGFDGFRSVESTPFRVSSDQDMLGRSSIRISSAGCKSPVFAPRGAQLHIARGDPKQATGASLLNISLDGNIVYGNEPLFEMTVRAPTSFTTPCNAMKTILPRSLLRHS